MAAFGAALRAWDGEPAACARAAELSARNGARLVACHLEGLDAVVTVEVDPAGLAGVGTARESARAGPDE
jgi:secretion/DNA translocation related TadE-like protein